MTWWVGFPKRSNFKKPNSNSANRSEVEPSTRDLQCRAGAWPGWGGVGTLGRGGGCVGQAQRAVAGAHRRRPGEAPGMAGAVGAPGKDLYTLKINCKRKRTVGKAN